MREKVLLFSVLLLGLAMMAAAIVAFKVTGVSVSVSEPEFSGSCPHRFHFSGRITVNREGTVRYRWLRSDASSGPEETLVFPAAGTQTVSAYWELGAGMGRYPDRWMAIEIIAPNPRTSNRAMFDLTCIPRVVLPSYSISGRVDSGPEGNKLAGRQVKVVLHRGGAELLSRTITLDAQGRGSYSFGGPIVGAGHYVIDVEKLPYSGSSTLNVCYEGTAPVSRTLDLTAAAPHAADQNFTIAWVIGWDRPACW